METIKIFKKRSYVFHFLISIAPIVFILVSLITGWKISGSIVLFGAIILFLILVFSTEPSFGISSSVSKLSSEVKEKSSKKYFRIGLISFISVCLILGSSAIIFFDGNNHELRRPVLILLAIIIFIGVISWTLAIMRYLKKQ
ncbi:MAG: hypothetical protein AAB822_00805 [Patescibacteria group bacterium]